MSGFNTLRIRCLLPPSRTRINAWRRFALSSLLVSAPACSTIVSFPRTFTSSSSLFASSSATDSTPIFTLAAPSRLELEQFFRRYKQAHQRTAAPGRSTTAASEQSESSAVHFSALSDTTSQEALRYALDVWLTSCTSSFALTGSVGAKSVGVSSSPLRHAVLAREAQTHQNPGLVRDMCALALEAGWAQRCCEVFFTSLPMQDLLAEWATAAASHSAVERGAPEAAVVSPIAPLWALFLDSLALLSAPDFSAVLQAAARLCKGPPVAEGVDRRGSVADRLANGDYYTRDYLHQCLAVAHMLVGASTTPPSLAVVSYEAVSKAHAAGIALALRLHCYALLEIVLEEEKRGPAPSSSSTSGLSRRRREALRGVAAEALALFQCGVRGEPMSQSGMTATASGTSTEQGAVQRTALLTQASLRRLRYRWDTLAHRHNASEKEVEAVMSLLPTPGSSLLSAVQYPTSEVERRILHDLFAVMSVDLLRVVINSFCHGSRSRNAAAVVVRRSPTVFTWVLRSISAARRWDLGRYVCLWLDQHWRFQQYESPSPFLNPSARCDGTESTRGTADDVSDSRTMVHHTAPVTEADEALLREQLRFFLHSRQVKEGLEWWVWLQDLPWHASQHVSARKTTVAPGWTKKDGASTTSVAHSAPNQFYPVPSIPILIALSRMVAEFAKSHDFHSLQQQPPQQRGRSCGRAPPTSRFLQHPAALALWCLETLLHAQQPTPPSGDALFLSVAACARAGLPELEQVLHSLRTHHVLALTNEEVLQLRLLHLRSDVRWKERLEELVPLLVTHVLPAPVPMHVLEASSLPAATSKKGGCAKSSCPALLQHLTPSRHNSRNNTAQRDTMSGVDGKHEAGAQPSFRLLPFPFDDDTLAERNLYRILLLLQEGNDSRCLPFYLYAQHRDGAALARRLPLHERVRQQVQRLPHSTSFFTPFDPVVDHDCRCLLLALNYVTVNLQALPKEWIWRIAVDALDFLQHTTVDGDTRTVQLTASHQHRPPVQMNPRHAKNYVSEANDEFVDDALVSPNAVSGDRQSRRSSCLPLLGIAADARKSLVVKWDLLRRQLPSEFWKSFLEALFLVQSSSPKEEEGRFSSLRRPRVSTTTVKKTEWSHLLGLPSELHLSNETCQMYLGWKVQWKSARTTEMEGHTNSRRTQNDLVVVEMDQCVGHDTREKSSSASATSLFRFLRRRGSPLFPLPHVFEEGGAPHAMELLQWTTLEWHDALDRRTACFESRRRSPAPAPSSSTSSRGTVVFSDAVTGVEGVSGSGGEALDTTIAEEILKGRLSSHHLLSRTTVDRRMRHAWSCWLVESHS